MPHGIKRRMARQMLGYADELLQTIMRDGKAGLSPENADRASYVSFASFLTLQAYLQDQTRSPEYPESAERMAEVAYGFGFDELAELVRTRGL